MISYRELKEDVLNFLQWASVSRYTWWSLALATVIGFAVGMSFF